MIAEEFNVFRTTEATNLEVSSVRSYVKVGTLRITSSPTQNQYTVTSGGLAMTEKEYDFQTPNTEVQLKKADKLVSLLNDRQFEITEVYKYDNQIIKIAGTMQLLNGSDRVSLTN